MNWKERKTIYIALIVSVLLHLIGLILITNDNLFAFSKTEPPEPPEPLELVFEQPKQPEQQLPEKFYEIVENPNASGDEPTQSDRLSTQSSISQAPVIMPGQIREVPGSETEQKNRAASQQPTEEMQERLQQALEKSILAYKENRTFSRSALTGEMMTQEERETSEQPANRGETMHRPDGFNADMVGDFALSSYEWEWAPWWLAFKRKLYRVWYVPAAYSELGLIHGHTILSFKISRNGEITELKVLRQVGHSSLETSSVNAVEAVFPFLPLPKEFPDEYLEVALKLIYPNLREYSRAK
ncbi:MAG: energy transducer TonB [Calditrichia bacterium]|jgi:outer membrane biosynthesis protein TonB|nr:energy transducer TonB [Calditrichia bacterium]MCK5452779.1 energy transducer TonB [Calditrichia bacterium]